MQRYEKNRRYKEDTWRLLNEILNMLRMARGLPLVSELDNPYLTRVG